MPSPGITARLMLRELADMGEPYLPSQPLTPDVHSVDGRGWPFTGRHPRVWWARPPVPAGAPTTSRSGAGVGRQGAQCPVAPPLSLRSSARWRAAAAFLRSDSLLREE